MKTPSVSATEPRRSILSTMMTAIWPSRREKAVPISRPAFRLEALEPRILLSADFMPEAAAAMADGFNQLNARMDQFLTGDAAFAERVPLLLKVTVDEDDTLVSEAPTVGDLLTVPVDANQDGFINRFGDFFDATDNDEDDLGLLDDDNDGLVDAGEFLDSWFFDRVRDRLNTADDTRAGFVSFLKSGGSFFDPIDLTLNQLGLYKVEFLTVDAQISDTTENPDAEVTFTVGIELIVSNTMPIDLGLEADGLKLFAYTGSSLDPQLVTVPVTTKLSFSFEFGVFTGGQDADEIDAGDFLVRKADPLLVSVVAKDDNLNFNLNIGFLGAEVIGGDFDLQVDVASALVDPNDPIALGFEDSQHGVEQTSGIVTAANAVPSANLDHAVGFFLRVGNVGITTPVFVSDNDAPDLATLKSHIQAAIANAGLDGIITADIDGANKLKFSLAQTTETPLGFANEALALNGIIQAAPDGNGASAFDFLVDQAFLLSVAGALPRLVTVRFTNSAEEEIGFGGKQEADLSEGIDQVQAANVPTVFDITGDANFTVTVTKSDGFQYTQAFALTAADTDGNANVLDLAADIDGKLDGTLFPLIIAQVEGGKIKFEALDGDVSAIRVQASGTATSEIGFASDAQTTLQLTAANNAINTGDLSASATFRVDVLEVGSGTTTKWITVAPSDNGGVADLAADIDAALAAEGLGGDLDAIAVGGKVVLVAKHVNVAHFEVTSENETIDDLVHDVSAALADAGLGGQVTASNSAGQLRLAAASGSIEITRTLTFDAGVTFAELQATPGSQLFEPAVDEAASHATIDFPVTVKPGLEDLTTGANDDWNPQDVAIVANFSPLGGTVAEFDAGLDRFTVQFDLTPETSVPEQDGSVPAVTSGALDEEARLVNMAEALNFNLVTSENVVGLLMGLGSALQQLTSLPEFSNYEIPFVDAELADLFNYTDPDKAAFSGLIDRILFDTGGDGLDGAADADKLLRKVTKDGTAYLLPAFVTAQELANKLHAVLGVALEGEGGINAAYHTGTNELTYRVDLIADDATATSLARAFDYDVDLGPFAKLTVDAAALPAAKQVTLDGRTGLAMTFGIDLDPPGIVINASTPIEDLNGGNGVDIRKTQAITGTVQIPISPAPGPTLDPNNPPPTPDPVQQLSGDALFSVSINGGAPVNVTVSASSVYIPAENAEDDPDGNRTMADLVADVNTALVNAGLATHLIADYDGQRLVLAARQAGVSFEIMSANSFTEDELGLQDGATSNAVDFVITDSSGGLHSIVLDSLSPTDSVQDVIDAINAQTGGVVTADFNAPHTGLRLVDNTAGPGTFRVDSVNGSGALLGLGFFLNNSVSSAFAGQDGNAYLIEGGAIGETHLDDRFFVRDAEMRIDGLHLETPDGGIPGQGLFGIVGVDTTFDGSFTANVTTELNGGSKTTLAQLFDKTGVLDDDPVVSEVKQLSFAGFNTFEAGEVITGADSDATAVVVGVEGNTLLLSNVKGSFVDGEAIGFFAAADGTVTTRDVFGEFELGVTVQPGFDDIGFGGGFALLDGMSYVVPVDLTGFGASINNVAPVADLDLSGIGDLAAFEHLSYAHLGDALHSLETLLVDVNDSFELFNTTLPAINRSVADLLKLVDGFERSVDNSDFVLGAADAALDPAGLDLPALTLQNIPQALRGAFGLPDDVDPSASGAVDWLRLDFDQANNELLLDLALNETLTTKLGLDIDVGEELPRLTSGGVLKVSGNLDINLNVAIDLDAPQDAYLLDTSGIAAELHVIGEGQEYAGGEDGLGLVFNASLGPLAVFIQDGDARIDVAFSLPGLDFGGSNRKLAADVTFEDFQPAQVDEDHVEIVLPMFYGGEGADDYLGDFSAIGDIATVVVETPDFSGIQVDIETGVIPFDPFDNINLAIDTVNLYLESLSDTLASEVLNLRLPFVGDQLADVLFLEELRETLVGTLKTGIANAINPDADTIVQELLADLFATGGELEGYLQGNITTFDNVGAPATNPDEWRRQWNLTLAHSETIVIDDFVLGIDNLGFDMKAPVEVQFDWTFDFGFGVNFGESAFIDVSDTNELDIDLTITLPAGTYTGEFGYLRVDASDPGSDSGVEVHFDVDMQNGNDTGSDKLGFSDLGAIGAMADVQGEALAAHAVSLHLVTKEVLGLPQMKTDLVIDWTLDETGVDGLGGDGVTEGVQFIALTNMELDSGSMADALLGPLLDEVGEFIEPFMPVIDTLTAPIPILSDIAGEPFTLLDLAGLFGTVDPAFIETVADILDVISAINDFTNAPWLQLGDLTLFDADGVDANFTPNGALLSDLPVSMGMTGLDHDATAYDAAIDGNSFLSAIKNEELADGLAMPILTDPTQGISMLLGQVADLISYQLNPLLVDFSYFQAFPVFGPLSVGIEIGFGFELDLHEVGFDTYGYKRYAEGGFRNPLVIFDGFFLGDLDENGVDAPEVKMMFSLVGTAELNLGIARAGVGGGIDATITFDWHDSIGDGNVHISEIVGNIVAEGGNPLAAFDVGGELTFEMFAFIEFLTFRQDIPITPETTLYGFEDTSARAPVLATKLPDGTLQLNMGPSALDRLNGDTSDGHEHFELEYLGGGKVTVWSDKLGVAKGDQVYEGVTNIVGVGGQGNDTILLHEFDGSGITGEFDGGVGDDRIEYMGSTGSTSVEGARIIGGLGNDTLTGGDANDVIYGGDGNDVIKGGGGYDILFGDQGRVADTLNPPFISSRITTADGDDKIEGGAADDVIFGGGGNDQLKGDDGDDVLIGDGGRFEYTVSGGHVEIASLRPTAYEPTPVETPVDPDVISAEIDAIYFAMADVFKATDLGFGGNDDIFGGADDDMILGGSGDDTVHGDGGDDIILGGKGFDDLHGGDDADSIFGGDQADTIAGDAGDDVISGGAGNDFIHGNEDDDVMKGDTGADVMFGDAGDDQVFGQTEPDILFGGADDDLVVGGTSNDIMFGDDGLVAKLNPSDGTVDRAIGIGNVALANDAFFDDDIRTTDLIVTDVRDDDGNDMMSGDAGDDLMFGGGGNDLMGGDVDPRLTSAGSPTEISEDVLIGDGGKVVLDQRRFRSIETVIGADTTGEPFNDVIYGDNGNDYIFGGRGSDFLFGGHGKMVDVGTETVGAFRGATDAEASDNDVIVGDNGEMLFADETVPENFGVLELIRTTDESDATGGHEYVEGELGDDVIFGGVNGSVDVLFGNVGNDVILGDNGELDFDFNDTAHDLTTLDLIRSYRDGLGGIDEISGNAGDDVLIGGTAGDQMFGDDAAASAGVADGEDVMLGDNADIFLIGTAGRLKVRVTDMPMGTAVDLITTTDSIDLGDPDFDTIPEVDAVGGPDTMSGNAKADIMLGGVNNGGTDNLYGDRAAPTAATIANDGDDILLGDNGLLDFTFGDSDRNILDLISSFEDGLGGTDVISGNKGLDVAIGGTSDDTIYGDDVSASAAANDISDLLLGDNADVFLVNPNGASGGDIKLVLSAAVKTIRTTDEEHPEYGGEDTISGNAGGDIIAGGVQGDTLYGDRAVPNATTSANDGNDVILGDNGAFEWLSTGRLGEVLGIDISVHNPALFAQFNGGVADTDLTTLDLVTTEQPTNGGRDNIYGDEGNDLAFGGTDLDWIHGDDGDEAAETAAANRDVLFGDHGRLYPHFSALSNFNSRNFFAIHTGDAQGGEGDLMWGEEGDDVMLGQQGDDRMWGGSQADDMIGGHNVEGGIDELTLPAVQAVSDPAPADTNDLMDGGSGNDAMKGDNVIVWRRGDDLSPRFRLLTGTSLYTTGPDGVDTIVTNVGGVSQSDPNDIVGRDVTVVDHADVVPDGRFGDDLMAGGADDDFMLGDLGNDVMQGDGSISAIKDPGLNTITTMHSDTGAPSSAGTLYFNVPEALTDGDDYIEGSGGDDLIYGGLGQDDIIGGSSSLFGLDTEEERPDGSDIIFGGAGAPARLARNDFVGATDTDTGTAAGVGAVPTGDDPQIVLADRHSRDADFIMGDNANIYRLVGAGDAYLQYNYDQSSVYENRGNERIVVRAMQQLDYTLGGADYAGGVYVDGAAQPLGQPADNGAGDLIHGESGDDYVFGMTGSDVIFGESDDDDIVGGYGNDWISGGTGQDGVLGDDGLVYTSRNSTTGEALYGVAGLLASDPSTKYNNGTALNELIATPGDIQLATINIAGELKKTADLVPFSFDPLWLGLDDEFPDDASNVPFADDIIFGGLGGDFLHGGSGDDAISGAEALEHAYVPTYDAQGNPDGVLDLGYDAFDLPSPVTVGTSIANPNPGNVLAFNPVDLDGQHLNNRFRAGEFDLYDEYDPLRKIQLTGSGELWKPGDAGVPLEFLLNFDQTEGIFRASGTVPKATGQQTESYPVAHDDGKDAIFGDLGNDWLVGGTGRDNVYGGWGNDLLNADDDQTTLGDAPKQGDPMVEGANDVPDTHPYYEDRAYGGAGRDILIGNTGGDRLIDWVGEYNSFLVPYAPFGQASVSRTLMPHLQEFLYALSAGDGADFTRYSDAIGGTPPAPTTNNPIPSRNGEPFGELGMVVQQDFAWGDQTGAPADPQAGNIPGGARDVLRSAGFQDGSMEGFFVDSGAFSVQNGVLKVAAASLGGDAASVFHVGDALPSYFEIQASISVVKPTAGWKANSFIIFDYQDDDNFKFAGIDVSNSKLVMGHRDASGWHVDEQATVQGGLKADKPYNVLVAINGLNVTLVVDNKQYFSHTYQARVVDGWSYGLKEGMVGVGSDNSRGTFDNVRVLVLPPAITFQSTDNFGDGVADLFPSAGQVGTWTVQGGRLTGSPTAGGIASSLIDLGIGGLDTSSYLELAVTLSTQGRAGFIFDRYNATDFKFAAIDAVTDQVMIGHYTERGGWTVDAVVAKTIDGGVNYKLGLAIKGATVNVTLNGQGVLGTIFNAIAVDGDFGLLASGTSASFDDFTVKTDDPAFAAASGSAMRAAGPDARPGAAETVTQAQLDAITAAAVANWTETLGAGDPRLAALGDAQVTIADLAGNALGYAEGQTVTVDVDGAGYGWFLDLSPQSSSEFVLGGDGTELTATPDSEAYGRMDLLTVVTHELGHLLGLDHDDESSFSVMDHMLAAGSRYLISDSGATDDPVSTVAGGRPRLAFDDWMWDDGVQGPGAAGWSTGWAASSGEESAVRTIDWNGSTWNSLSPFQGGKPGKSAPNVTDFLLRLNGGNGGPSPRA